MDWLIICNHSLLCPLWVTCCLSEASVAQGLLSHPLWLLGFNISSLEDLTNALPSMRTLKSLCNDPTKKGICIFSIIKGWSMNSGIWNMLEVASFLSSPVAWLQSSAPEMGRTLTATLRMIQSSRHQKQHAILRQKMRLPRAQCQTDFEMAAGHPLRQDPPH